MVARSIAGYPVASDYGDPILATGYVPGTGLTEGSRRVSLTTRKAWLPLFLALAADYHRTVAPIDTGIVDDWSISIRQANASSSMSDHAAGVAIDLNATTTGAQGPNGGMSLMTAAQIKACVALKHHFEVVIWGGDKARGGDYSQPRYWDPMHYAAKPGTNDTDAKRVVSEQGIALDGTRGGARSGLVVRWDNVGAKTVTRHPDGTITRRATGGNYQVNRVLRYLAGGRSSRVTREWTDWTQRVYLAQMAKYGFTNAFAFCQFLGRIQAPGLPGFTVVKK